jgi:hypothetical protein
MTNKRITELTALDGDDVADNDVLAIVDVSDTTMAASGTTKKITVAELVTDSALTNKFWPNSSTALTGADLANTDRLAVLDVGTPDVPKYITADELAQGSQFTSRFVAKADDFVLVDAGRFEIAAQTPSRGRLGNSGYVGWLFDQTTGEAIAATTRLPLHFSTFHVDLYWTNAGAGAGDVFWRLGLSMTGDTESLPNYTAGFISFGAVTAPSENVLKVTRLTATARTNQSGELVGIYLDRLANDAADTLGNDCGVVAVLITKAS